MLYMVTSKWGKELVHGPAGIAAVVPQFFVETVIKGRVGGHQQDQVAAGLSSLCNFLLPPVVADMSITFSAKIRVEGP